MGIIESFLIFLFFIPIFNLLTKKRKYKFHRESKHIEKDQLPGISIIKPLMGVDENLLENLETFFVMDYPIYEILFCVQDCTDPVINIVKHLMEKYPNIDAKLFSGRI
jgi:ceramide glucosyltransferase